MVKMRTSHRLDPPFTPHKWRYQHASPTPARAHLIANVGYIGVFGSTALKTICFTRLHSVAKKTRLTRPGFVRARSPPVPPVRFARRITRGSGVSCAAEFYEFRSSQFRSSQHIRVRAHLVSFRRINRLPVPFGATLGPEFPKYPNTSSGVAQSRIR